MKMLKDIRTNTYFKVLWYENWDADTQWLHKCKKYCSSFYYAINVVNVCVSCVPQPPRRKRRTKRGSPLRKNPKKRSTLIWRRQRQRKQLWQYRISLDASRRKRSRKGKPEQENRWTKTPFTIFIMERELTNKRQRKVKCGWEIRGLENK